MDIISINKTMTKESKQTKTKTLFFLVALKGAILNGSTKSHFDIFLNFLYKEELSGFFFYKFLILLGYGLRS